jgi:cyclophilin family peptidyl-prolyl cis-trans isomerase
MHANLLWRVVSLLDFVWKGEFRFFCFVLAFSSHCPSTPRYYDGTPFHRLVPNFVLQGGERDHDGGACFPNGPLETELNARLRFTARGVVVSCNWRVSVRLE